MSESIDCRLKSAQASLSSSRQAVIPVVQRALHEILSSAPAFYSSVAPHTFRMARVMALKSAMACSTVRKRRPSLL